MFGMLCDFFWSALGLRRKLCIETIMYSTIRPVDDGLATLYVLYNECTVEIIVHALVQITAECVTARET
jgi:hypothetical protein